MKRFMRKLTGSGIKILGYGCGVLAVPLLLIGVVFWDQLALVIGSILLVLGVVLTYKGEDLEG